MLVLGATKKIINHSFFCSCDLLSLLWQISFYFLSSILAIDVQGNKCILLVLFFVFFPHFSLHRNNDDLTHIELFGQLGRLPQIWKHDYWVDWLRFYLCWILRIVRVIDSCNLFFCPFFLIPTIFKATPLGP